MRFAFRSPCPPAPHDIDVEPVGSSSRFGAAMTQKSGSDDANPVAVGYGRPPAQTRFQSGQSGNPGGRPKGSRNKATAVETSGIYDMILAEAKRTIKVDDGGDVVSM